MVFCRMVPYTVHVLHWLHLAQGTCWICRCTVSLSKLRQQLALGDPGLAHALQEAELDAAASQVQVATMQRQLTAARCTSLLELRQQVLGGAGADTSAPDVSTEEFSFRPSRTANEGKGRALCHLEREGKEPHVLVRLPFCDFTLVNSPIVFALQTCKDRLLVLRDAQPAATCILSPAIHMFATFVCAKGLMFIVLL